MLFNYIFLSIIVSKLFEYQISSLIDCSTNEQSSNMTYNEELHNLAISLPRVFRIPYGIISVAFLTNIHVKFDITVWTWDFLYKRYDNVSILCHSRLPSGSQFKRDLFEIAFGARGALYGAIGEANFT